MCSGSLKRWLCVNKTPQPLQTLKSVTHVKRHVFPPAASPTDEVVPLGVQVGLIRQAAFHHVEAQRVAWPQGGQAAAQGAVPLTHQPADTLRVGSQLGDKETR